MTVSYWPRWKSDCWSDHIYIIRQFTEIIYISLSHLVLLAIMACSLKCVKKFGKAKKSASAVYKKRQKRCEQETFTIYILKVLKIVHPDINICSAAMSIMNSCVNYLFERLAAKSLRLCQYSRKSTISSHDVEAAVLLSLPKDLAKHAILEGRKAMTNYKASM